MGRIYLKPGVNVKNTFTPGYIAAHRYRTSLLSNGVTKKAFYKALQYLNVMSFIYAVLNGGARRTLFGAQRRKSLLAPWVLITLISALLASCSSTHRDGPPSFYVDETRIPNAVPKPEKLAKYGNMRAYDIKGKRYHVMKSSKNYTATGTASWYGSMFHSRKTSSGERYDMLAMTAAHPTLPLPTYVRVKNLNNNREVIVKVNDRGPFKCNRIIDLSYVAAKKLGMLGRGTARVRVTAIDPYTYGRKPIYASNAYKCPKQFKVKQFQPSIKRSSRELAMKKTKLRRES